MPFHLMAMTFALVIPKQPTNTHTYTHPMTRLHHIPVVLRNKAKHMRKLWKKNTRRLQKILYSKNNIQTKNCVSRNYFVRQCLSLSFNCSRPALFIHTIVFVCERLQNALTNININIQNKNKRQRSSVSANSLYVYYFAYAFTLLSFWELSLVQSTKAQNEIRTQRQKERESTLVFL